MSIRFKTPEALIEFSDPHLAKPVWAMILFAAGFVGYTLRDYELMVTAVYYPAGANGSKSLVHPEWRGIDFTLVTKGTEYRAPKHILDLVAEAINSVFKLDAGEMKAAVVHDNGHGLHSHCQTDRDLTVTVSGRMGNE